MNNIEKVIFGIMILTILIVGYRSYERHRYDIPKNANRITVNKSNINKIQEELNKLRGN